MIKKMIIKEILKVNDRTNKNFNNQKNKKLHVNLNKYN